MPSRGTSLHARIARSCGATAALLPVFPELFDGIDALGSRPALIARILQRHGVTRRSRVLDLGCGKGAVAVELARRTGCRVVGVDAFAPFVAAARALAQRRGVSTRCTFTTADARSYRPRRLFDAAVMLNVVDAPRAAATLRTHVRTGGLYVIDDAFAAPPARGRRPPGPDIHELRASITRRGDIMVQEIVPTPSSVRRSSARVVRRLGLNAERILKSHPNLRRALHELLHAHRTAAECLGGPLRPVVWALARSPGFL